MKLKSFRNWTWFSLILIADISVSVEARRLVLRPLTQNELRDALEESGIGSESAAGKSVASAFAGLSGFALGITKGIGGSILFDVVTSNVTIDYLTSLLNSTANSTTSSSSETAQEICFNSRSADGEVIQGRSNDDVYIDDSVYPSEEWREAASSSTTDNSWTVINGHHRNNNRYQQQRSDLHCPGIKGISSEAPARDTTRNLAFPLLKAAEKIL